MKYIIENVDDKFNVLESSICDLGLSYYKTQFGSLSAVYDLKLQIPYSQYFPFVSVNTMLFCKTIGCNVFFDPTKFSYTQYIEHWKEDFLNHDAIYTTLDKIKDYSGIKFFRDIHGDNVIKGSVTNNFRDLYDNYIGRTQYGKYIDESYPVILSSPKDIAEEYRFFIVKGDPITGSQYAIRGSHYIRNIDISMENPDIEILAFVYYMIDKYSPDESFVIDVARLSSGDLKVIECNCINSSGFYAIDIRRLLECLELRYNEKRT